VNTNIINAAAGFSPPPTGQVAVVVVRTLKGYRGQIVAYGTETILFESKPRKTAGFWTCPGPRQDQCAAVNP
jgi:hypothetical protein